MPKNMKVVDSGTDNSSIAKKSQKWEIENIQIEKTANLLHSLVTIDLFCGKSF